jgi:hypothetical protein
LGCRSYSSQKYLKNRDQFTSFLSQGNWKFAEGGIVKQPSLERILVFGLLGMTGDSPRLPIVGVKHVQELNCSAEDRKRILALVDGCEDDPLFIVSWNMINVARFVAQIPPNGVAGGTDPPVELALPLGAEQ